MSKKIKVLFYGDAPNVATGFGNVSRNLLTGLEKTGKYEFEILGVNHHGNPHSYPWPIWPIGLGSQDPYGRQKAVDMMVDPKREFDVLFMFQDSFILQFMRDILPGLKQRKKFSSVVYYPIDGVPKTEWVEAMNMFDYCATYTEFGKRESILACPDIINKLKVIPHGSNSSDFYVVSKDEVLNFRKNYFGPHSNKFIVTNVNRNQQRKDIPRCIAAFKLFKEKHPESVLYLHMAQMDQGWNIPEVVRSYGLSMGDDVLTPGKDFGPNQGYPRDIVNLIYNASDLVVSSTVGEGWGLSITEAMATNTPVLFPKNTSLVEIIGENEERGWFIDSGTTENLKVVLPSDNEVVRPIVDIEHMASQMSYIHDNRGLAKKKAEKAFSWVNKELSWNKIIVPMWDKLLTEAASRKDSDNNKIISVEDL